MSAPAEVVTPPDASLCSSLRFTLSLEPKRTLPLERELTSGDVSGKSSALVGVTVKRTDDAMASRAATDCCCGSDRMTAPGPCCCDERCDSAHGTRRERHAPMRRHETLCVRMTLLRSTIKHLRNLLNNKILIVHWRVEVAMHSMQISPKKS